MDESQWKRDVETVPQLIRWKRGVPEASGVYWCRVDDSDSDPTLVKLPEGGGVYDFGCEENITESVADFEFCPLREKAPE